MSQPLLIAFVVFAAVMYFTPGPNNVMLLASGLTHGFRRTLPHIAGITFGMGFMVAAVGFRPGDHLHHLSGAADDPEIRRRDLSDLSRSRDRDVRGGALGAEQSARPDDILGRGGVPVG